MCKKNLWAFAFLILCFAVQQTTVAAIVTPTTSPPAILATSLSDVVEVSAGGLHTCAVLNNGKIKCWGRNGYGQLGNGTKTDSSTPVMVKQ